MKKLVFFINRLESRCFKGFWWWMFYWFMGYLLAKIYL